MGAVVTGGWGCWVESVCMWLSRKESRGDVAYRRAERLLRSPTT